MFMKKLKLFVCAAFIAGSVGVSLYSSSHVAGQGGSSLAAPTGVIASDNKYNNKIRVEWDTIRGATTYRIFRGTTSNSGAAADIGTTVANSFLDTSAPAAQTFFYWVRAENSNGVSSLSASDTGSRTNTTQQGPVAPLEAPPVPAGNPITAGKVYLGKSLFWDEQMSSTGTVSCGTCHQAGGGGDDLRAKNTPAVSVNPGINQFFGDADDIVASRGVPATNADGTYTFSSLYGFKEQVTGRSSMSYLNAGYSPTMFWDGRATGTFRDPITNAIILNNGAALESQVLGPPLSSTEMAHGGRDWNQVASRIANSKPLALASNIPAPLVTWLNGRSYSELFNEVFGTPEVTPSRIAMAIATYERTLYTDQAPVDLANAGIAPLTAQEQNGRNLFVQNECAVCHAGSLTSDNTFRYIGVRPPNDDTGRFQVTGNNGDLGRFRTPSLRNVELRGTYFHNGRFNTLDQVVAFYNRGGDFNAPNKDPDVRPRGLNAQQQADIVAFLKRPLTDPRVAAEAPPFDRPMLYTESSRMPQITGTGRAGSGGLTPQIMAISPPLVGNPNFTVSVSGAFGNGIVVLVIDVSDPGVGTAIPAAGSFARVTANTQGTGSGNGWASVSIPIPDDPQLVGKTFFARWYVTDVGAANGFSVTQAARFTVFGEATAVARAKYVDFDGDSKTDISVYRPDSGLWYVLRSSDSVLSIQQFGISTDVLAPADYDGDQKTDIAVFRNGTWYLNRSRDGITVVQFGLAGDIVQPGDFDGDGKDDLALYRPSDGTWYLQQSRDGFAAERFGITADKPVAADYDGDAKTDIAVYRDGQWWIKQSTGVVKVANFGQAGDKPVAGDYDGDNKADIAVWRPSTGTWFRIRSTDGQVAVANYGISTDIPAPGDYDGDGNNDLTVYRPTAGLWFAQNSSGSERILQFGLSTDRPVPSAIVP